ncbi:hypothetical protein [Haloglycomyces albus]|uniref:hypothetical protein n=1 Tax=Haloglycomyces albus TaxID=526067 RepID=UPI0012ECB329|nr:hypothetical protein [Haloglycomyces albus]
MININSNKKRADGPEGDIVFFRFDIESGGSTLNFNPKDGSKENIVHIPKPGK